MTSTERPFDKAARECREALEGGDVAGAKAALEGMRAAQSEDLADLDAIGRVLHPRLAADTTRGDSDGD